MNVFHTEVQCLLGVACRDFAMIAADMTYMNAGLVLMKNDEHKVFPITDTILMGVAGDPGDRAQFSQYIARSLKLYSIRNQYPLSTSAAVHFTRNSLADTMRSSFSPCIINLLIGGYDGQQGGQLYFMDFLASSVKVPFAAHGYGGKFCIGVLDSRHKPTLTESEAYTVMELAIAEIHQRFFINHLNFAVKVVSKDGIRTLPIITPNLF